MAFDAGIVAWVEEALAPGGLQLLQACVARQPQTCTTPEMETMA